METKTMEQMVKSTQIFQGLLTTSSPQSRVEGLEADCKINLKGIIFHSMGDLDVPIMRLLWRGLRDMEREARDLNLSPSKRNEINTSLCSLQGIFREHVVMVEDCPEEVYESFPVEVRTKIDHLVEMAAEGRRMYCRALDGSGRVEAIVRQTELILRLLDEIPTSSDAQRDYIRQTKLLFDATREQLEEAADQEKANDLMTKITEALEKLDAEKKKKDADRGTEGTK